MDSAEVLEILKKLQDPNFRRQARGGLTLMCTAGAGLATLLILSIAVLIAHKAWTPPLLGGVLGASCLNGILFGRWLSNRILRTFQQKIREKAGFSKLFDDF
jgi:hypothetical protein